MLANAQTSLTPWRQLACEAPLPVLCVALTLLDLADMTPSGDRAFRHLPP